MSPTELPPRQAEAIEVIRKLTLEQRFPPTVREIAQAMHVSHSTARQYLLSLETKGRITRSVATSRSIVIIDPQAAVVAP